MRIHSVETRLVQLPGEESLAGGPMPSGLTRDFVTATVRTDEGIEGIGFGFLFGNRLTTALKSALDELCGLVLGDDPLQHAAVHRKLSQAISAGGPEGLALIALSAIDIALWDIKARAAGLPLATLLGACQTSLPAYASGALRREYGREQLERSASRLREAGFRQMKMQLALPGTPTVAQELDMARVVRDAVGPDTDLMVDINHRWSGRQALSMAPRLEEFGFYWLEDPVARDDYAGMAAIAQSLATPLASGEAVFGIVPFRQLMQAGSIDIAMVDVFRVGGVTGWMKVAAMAEAFNLPVTSHLAPEISVHLVGALPNGLNVEYIPWSFGMFQEVPQPVDGMLAPFGRPGLGLEFDADAMRRWGSAPTRIGPR